MAHEILDAPEMGSSGFFYREMRQAPTGWAKASKTMKWRIEQIHPPNPL
jgi:hypothetical protein